MDSDVARFASLRKRGHWCTPWPIAFPASRNPPVPIQMQKASEWSAWSVWRRPRQPRRQQPPSQSQMPILFCLADHAGDVQPLVSSRRPGSFLPCLLPCKPYRSQLLPNRPMTRCLPLVDTRIARTWARGPRDGKKTTRPEVWKSHGPGVQAHTIGSSGSHPKPTSKLELSDLQGPGPAVC